MEQDAASRVAATVATKMVSLRFIAASLPTPSLHRKKRDHAQSCTRRMAAPCPTILALHEYVGEIEFEAGQSG
jgi:hypothetical protein